MNKITDIRKNTVDGGIVCKVNGAKITIDCDLLTITYHKPGVIRCGVDGGKVTVRSTYCITDDPKEPFLLSERLINGHYVPWEYDSHPSFSTIPDAHAITAHKNGQTVCSIEL